MSVVGRQKSFAQNMALHAVHCSCGRNNTQLMYKLCDSTKVDPDEDISVSWGNGILYDRDKVWLDYTNMVASGLLRPEIAIAWYFDLRCETPEDMAKIREKYMPEINTLLGGE